MNINEWECVTSRIKCLQPESFTTRALSSMSSFFNFRRTRYTAAAMLFVWLMSLGLGIANACLVQQDQGWHEHSNLSHSGMASAALAEHHVAPDKRATAHIHIDENDKSPEKMACLNFCLAEQSTLVKHYADGLADLDVAPVLFLTWLLVPAVEQASQPQAVGSPTWSEPPVSIRYLRLTI